MVMHLTYDKKSYGEAETKRIRCMPVWVKTAVESREGLLPCSAGVVYQIQKGEFVDQGSLKVFYQQQYFNSKDPLYPELNLEDGFNELLKEFHPNNLTHPLAIYGLLTNTDLVSRGPVYLVKAKYPAPLTMLDAMTGWELGLAPSSATCALDFIKKEVLDRIDNMEFWKDEITHHEDIHGRPRQRHYPNPNARE